MPKFPYLPIKNPYSIPLQHLGSGSTGIDITSRIPKHILDSPDIKRYLFPDLLPKKRLSKDKGKGAVGSLFKIGKHVKDKWVNYIKDWKQEQSELDKQLAELRRLKKYSGRGEVWDNFKMVMFNPWVGIPRLIQKKKKQKEIEKLKRELAAAKSGIA